MHFGAASPETLTQPVNPTWYERLFKVALETSPGMYPPAPYFPPPQDSGSDWVMPVAIGAGVLGLGLLLLKKK